ncbi:hypothetical protein NM688_g4901 [Phlebia brevispora]|uniref:Uncharacterized protein n=1 Tax=Phlebia brevispora TaxID=194682 RepID=A0ACC1T1Q2_9APHY|nr:hypothetical protein NM688_g4901 [Phlebia brevispora]
MATVPMSSAQLDLPSAEEFRLQTISYYVIASATVWVSYEYFVAFSEEVRHFWGSRPTMITVIFMALRYGMLFRQALQMTSFIRWDTNSKASVTGCIILNRATLITDAILYCVVILLAGARIRAISMGYNNAKTSVVIVLGMVFVCCDSWVSSHMPKLPLPVPLSGCGCYYPADGTDQNEGPSPARGDRTQARNMNVILSLGIVCMILSELVVQFYTWESMLKPGLLLKNGNALRQFYRALLRDGTLIYLTTSIWTIGTTLVAGKTGIQLQSINLPGVSIMICRVILRLRRTQEADSTVRRQGDTTYARRSQAAVDTSTIQNLTTIPADLSGGVGENGDFAYLSDSRCSSAIEPHQNCVFEI